MTWDEFKMRPSVGTFERLKALTRLLFNEDQPDQPDQPEQTDQPDRSDRSDRSEVVGDPHGGSGGMMS